MEPGTPTSVSEEARLELSMAAAANERGNRPKWVIAIGVVMLLIAGAYTLWAVSARTAVLLQVATERARINRLMEVKTTLDTENARVAARASPADPRTGQYLEQLATAADIVPAPTVTDQPPIGAGGATAMQPHKYTARIQNEDPRQILTWLASTQTSNLTPGLEISRLVLRPGAATSEGGVGWNADVEFTRWEKK